MGSRQRKAERPMIYEPYIQPVLSPLPCAVFVAQSASAQKVSTKLDDKYNFSEHKRYEWRENRLSTRQHPDTNQVMDLKINRLLAAKGFVEAKDKPDFCIFYDGGGNVQVGAGGASQAGSGPITAATIAPDYGLGNGPTLSRSPWMKVNRQIEFHVVDAAAHKPV
jgi:hypothetical protein